MNPPSAIRKLPANRQGKDYVIGDLHGCLDLLQRLLDEVGFDQNRDRLFSVGDLIDRGPDSLGCLHLLKHSWFYSVQGNHENMLLNFFLPYLQNNRMHNLDDVNQTDFLWNGGDWIIHYFLEDQQRMTPEFDQGLLLALNMPLMLVIGDGENRFHVIHAELVKPGFRRVEPLVWLDSDIDQWLDAQTIPAEVEERLYWARTIMTEPEGRALARIQPGLSPTFCGHTFGTRPRQVLSHICLDTGAFMSTDFYRELDSDDHGLTLFDVKNACWVSASYQHEDLIRGEFPV
ncbi:MAG: metallophosphoesterase [Methylomonas sp.]